MRDYLYIWNDPSEGFIVASGIEFRDFAPLFSNGGIVLLDHAAEAVEHDSLSRFDFVTASGLPTFCRQDIYGWGDFVWADYCTDRFPSIPKEEVAELLYFAHAATPLRSTRVGSLCNRFLTYVHDDGWFLKTYYADWSLAALLLARAAPSLSKDDFAAIQTGQDAFWIQGGHKSTEAKTFDIDSVLNRRMNRA
jgi:hypothetical protein